MPPSPAGGRLQRSLSVETFVGKRQAWPSYQPGGWQVNLLVLVLGSTRVHAIQPLQHEIEGLQIFVLAQILSLLLVSAGECPIADHLPLISSSNRSLES